MKKIALSQIVIPEEWQKTKPKRKKVVKALEFLMTYGRLDNPIIVDKNMELIDGYARYIMLETLGYDKPLKAKKARNSVFSGLYVYMLEV